MTDKPYTISIAKPEEYKNIEDFLQNSFFKDMPLFQIFGFNEIPRRSVFSPETIDTIPFVVKASSSEGEIIGVAIQRSKLIFPPTPEDADIRIFQLEEFMKFVQKNAKVSSLPESTIELRILSVKSDWRGKGIAKQLTEESMRVAKLRGYELMKICCTSEFTARLVKSLGFQEIYKLAYSDYNILSQKNVELIACPPHLHICYYTKYL